MMGFKNRLAFKLLVLLSLAAPTGCGEDGKGPSEVGDLAGDGDLDASPDGPDTTTDSGRDGDLDPIICRPCTSSVNCELPGNACINLPSGESVCGVDCAPSPDICPEGTFCANVGADGAVRQCVPEELFCVNQCGDPPLDCETEGEICDPLTGLCNPPLDLCTPCAIDEQCGENNLCLTFPDIDNSRACGRDCRAGEACPTGYACAQVSADGTERQCVPDTLTCIDRCSDVACRQGQTCDPLTGECVTPLGICDECLTSAQCGAGNICLTLLDGNAYCGLDCGITAPAPGVCPAGFVCQALGQGLSQCVPTLLTCVDHCEEPDLVECGVDSNCDPIDGTCHASTLGLCGAPCDNNYTCGGQDDLCVSLDGLAAPVCAADCTGGDPCPIGYSCFDLTDGVRQQCAPSDFEDGCAGCAGVDCGPGEACRPTDGSCLPLPPPCTTNTECPTGELCNVFEDRCEPVGLPCRPGEFFDCTSSTSCSAVSVGMDGICLQECSALPEGCPDYAPECENFYRIFIGVCVERGLGGPESCGRFSPSTEQVGRPCPLTEDDPNCPLTAEVCLTDVVDGIPGFCTASCDPLSETPCSAGGTCSRVPGELASYCLPEDCRCLAVPQLELGAEDVLRTALDELGLSRCDLSYNQAERDVVGVSVANDPFRVSLVGEVRNEALVGVDAMRRQGEAFDAGVSVTAAIELAAANLGHPVTADPVDPGGASFCEAVRGLWTTSLETAPTCEALAELEAAIPADLLADLIEALVALEVASAQRDGIFRGLTAPERTLVFAGAQRLVVPGDEAPFDVYAHRPAFLSARLDLLYEEGASLAATLESLPLAPDREGGPVVLDERLSTPRGLILLEGDADHTYCRDATGCSGADNPVLVDEPLLLLVDTGGNDTYLIAVGATVGIDHAASVALDLGGDDLYGYTASGPAGTLLAPDEDGRGESPLRAVSLSQTGRQGSGRGGYGFLFDRGLGADSYASLRMSQGFGLLGVGVLSDDGCDDGTPCRDLYAAESLSQGAGLFGIGVLLTGSGNAELEGWHLVQGAGGPMGAGLLVAERGDDTYVAVPGTDATRLFVAPAVPTRGNYSAAQGAGVGVPSSTPLAGGNVSGGVGVLLDLAGTDSYTAGLFAQGGGYWHGLGMLVEGDGDDTFEVHAWAQGAGLDFGVGLFADQAGADEHNVDVGDEPRVLGSGENFGVGLALDEAGADLYSAGSQALGVGFFNGTGVFVDNDGNDTYALSSEETLGKATLTIIGSEPPDNPRRLARTVGVFVDASGTDTYTGRSLFGIGNNLSWVQVTPGATGLLEWGVGADRIGGTGLTTR